MRRIAVLALSFGAVTLGCEVGEGPDDAEAGPVDAEPDGNVLDFVERYAPESGSIVPRNAVVEVVFREQVHPETVLLELAGAPVPLVTLDDRTFRFVALPLLEPDLEHEARVLAGVEDLGSAVLDGDLVWSFRTEPGRVEVDGDRAWSPDEADHVTGGETDEPMEFVQDWEDPSSSLYEISTPVDPLAPETQHLVARMMRSVAFHGGIGLAAPQVGLGRRMFVADLGEGFEAFLNPELVAWSEDLDEMGEGCLSIPGQRLDVFRPRWVEVSYDREDGTRVEGRTLENPEANPFFFPARVWLHEFDHLHGVLITMRAGDLAP